MKKILNILMLVSLVVISACRKSDNATMPDGIVYLNQAQITKVEGGDPAILDTDPMGFASTVRVELYFENSEKPDHLDLVVMKNGDTKNVKTLQADISSYPTDVEINGQQLTDLFGEEIVSGDQFDIGADYVVGGKTYAAFPEGSGTGYGPGASNQPDSSPAVRYSAICGFDVETFVGDFEVTVDGWDDFGVGTIVTVEAIDENTIAIPYTPVPSFSPITIDINTGDNTANAARQGLGDTEAYGLAYGTIYLTSTGGGTQNFVNPCDGTIRINASYTVAAGSFGTFVLELKKVSE